jgi:CFEM domain
MQLTKALALVVLALPNVLAAGETGPDIGKFIFGHNTQALHALHATPKCAQICHFNQQIKDKSAAKCIDLKGEERYRCLCKTHAYTHDLEDCFQRTCNGLAVDKVLFPFLALFNVLIG